MREIVHDNKLNILFYGLLFISFILFAFNTDNVDYKNYEYAYHCFENAVENNYLEFGFEYFMRLCIVFGISYQGFLFVCATITLILFAIALKRLSNVPWIPLLFFMIYPFILDIVQYRNFIGFAFVLVGISYLVEDNYIKSIGLFTFFVCLASIFHQAMLIYLAFAFIKFKHTIILALVSVLGSLVIGFIVCNPAVFYKLLEVFHLTHFSSYKIQGDYVTVCRYLIVYAIFMAISALKYYYVDHIPMVEKITGKETYETRLFRILILVLPYILFIFVDGTGARFFRNMFVVFYIFISYESSGLDLGIVKKKRYEADYFKMNRLHFEITRRQWNIIVRILCMAVAITIFKVQLCSAFYWSRVVYPVIINNLLW